jgi:hypothetical protein
MLHAMLLALSVAAPAGPSIHRLTVGVHRHAMIDAREIDIRGWSAQSRGGRVDYDSVHTDPDKKRVRIAIEGTVPGEIVFDIACGTNRHQIWLVKVQP